jgi:hypothetical protein
VNQTLQIAVGRTGADNRQWRRVDRGRRGHVEMGNRLLRDEDSVERQDDGVGVLDMSGEVVVAWTIVMVVFEVRVRDHLVVAISPLGAVHVLRWGQRQASQSGDEAERYRAAGEHSTGMLRDRRQAQQLKSR